LRKAEYQLDEFGSEKMLNGPRYTCAFFSSELVKLIFSFAQETEVISGAILKGLNLIDGSFIEELKNAVPKEHFDAIFAELKRSEDGKLKPIYDKFEGQYSYATIQLVRLFVRLG
jgi:hypothetical protein